MVIGQSTGQIALQRRITPPAQDWAIVKPIQVWADKEKLDQMLATLASFEIQEVASTDGGAIEIPNPIPENAAVFQFQVYGIEQPLTQQVDGFVVPRVVSIRVHEKANALLLSRCASTPRAYGHKQD